MEACSYKVPKPRPQAHRLGKVIYMSSQAALVLGGEDSGFYPVFKQKDWVAI